MKSYSHLFTAGRFVSQLSSNQSVVSPMTMATTTSDSIAPPRKRPKRLRRGILAVLSVIIALSWLQPSTPRFELMTADEYQRRTERFAFIQRARAWMTRLSPKIFGFAAVHISAAYVAKDESDLLAELPEALYTSNAVKVWILASNVVARAERNLLANNITRWRINTSEGIPSVLSTGPESGGTLDFASHPKIRGGSVDLAAKVRSVSSLSNAGGVSERTNHETIFRLLLKPGEGGVIRDDSGVFFVWAYAPPRQ
jgi:hypothetical protein